MNTHPQKDWPLGRAATALTLLATAIFIAASAAYVHNGQRLLERLSLSVGEVLMKEGIGLENAGALESARERYTAALATRFAGEQNRAHTLKLLGSLYWNEGNYERARTYLRDAVESPSASPTYFPPYCDTLLHLKAWDEAAPAIERWQQMLAKTNDTEAMAEAKYFEGRVALGKGDRARAKTAFNEGIRLAPGGKNAAELALLDYQDKDFQAALTHIDAYLDTAPTGDRATQLRALRNKLTP